MRHPLDGTQTPEREEQAERIAIILDGNPGMSETEAQVIARRCIERSRAGYSVAQQPLPLKESA